LVHALPPSTAASGRGHQRPRRAQAAAGFYRWRLPLRIAGWALVVAALVFAVPTLLLGLAVLVGLAGLLLTLVGLEAPASTLRTTFSGWVDALFAPGALPTTIPRLVLFVLLLGVTALVAGGAWSMIKARASRRTRHSWIWGLVGAR
jgi:hypothetical protein